MRNQHEKDYIPQNPENLRFAPVIDFFLHFLIDIIDNVITYSLYSPYYVTKTSTNGCVVSLSRVSVCIPACLEMNLPTMPTSTLMKSWSFLMCSNYLGISFLYFLACFIGIFLVEKLGRRNLLLLSLGQFFHVHIVQCTLYIVQEYTYYRS